MGAIYDEHYVRFVTAMGDRREVVTSAPIYGKNNIKVVERGVRIDSSLYERLIQHKLAPPLDSVLNVSGAVSPALLVQLAREQTESCAVFRHMRASLDVFDRALEAFGSVPLPAPLAFKLTVAQDQCPELFEHCVQMAMLSLYVACRCGLAERELPLIAAAGLFHDLGMMHVDPQLTKPGHVLSEAERRHIFAHPLTAFMLLSSYSTLAPEIAAAVMEHHERLDGSGYPRGLRAEEISIPGQILMLAEVACAMLAKGWERDHGRRLSVVLKVNLYKFNKEMVGHLLSLVQLGDAADSASAEATNPGAIRSLEQIADFFRVWHAADHDFLGGKNAGTGGQGVPLMNFVVRRVIALERTLNEAGFDRNALEMLIDGIDEDAHALDELLPLADEAVWQLRDIVHEVRRRWPDLGGAGEVSRRVEEWLQRTEALIARPS